jgi:pimeloyl-ACP methyl ester carboxylesterase
MVGWEAPVHQRIMKRNMILIGIALAGLAVVFVVLSKNGCLSKQEPLAMIETTTIEIEGLSAWYRTAGDPSKRPIVFLHGWGARRDDVCGRGIDRVVTELSNDYRVVALELPGLIRSDPPPTAWGMNEYAAFVHAFIERMQFSQPPVLMGQSFGGGIASTVAEQYPEDVPVLVLVDATQGNRPENAYYQFRFYWKTFYD